MLWHIMADLKDHQIPVTIIASLISALLITGGILSFVKKNTFIARRKSAQYIVLATFGLVFYLRDNLALVWTYPEYNKDTYNTYLYYLLAVPVHHLPVLARSWRIYCIYRPSPNWRCRMDTNSVKRPKNRGHAWMFLRMGLWMIPWGLIALLGIYDHTMNIAYYFYIGLEGTCACTSMAINWKLYTMRDELRPKFLDENESLLIYSIICVIEWLWTNSVYLIIELGQVEQLLPIYIYGDLLLIFLMWALTGGRMLYKVWRESHLVDSKPAINCPELRYSNRPSIIVLDISCSEVSEGSSNSSSM